MEIVKLGELRKLTHQIPDLQDQQLELWLHEKLRSLGIDPNSIYQELEMTSRYVDTHRDTSHFPVHKPLHSHTFYELLFCCNNCGAEYIVGSDRYRLQEGDIIFIPPGVSHRPLLPGTMTSPYKRYVIWLSMEFMEQYARLLPYPFTEKQAKANILRTGGTGWEYLGELFRNGVLESETQADGWEAAVIGNTIQLLTHIKRATDTRSTQPMKAEKPELTDRITAYIENHYAENISVPALGQQFYVSGSTISHLFKEQLGVSVHRYVIQRRLIAAKTGIEQGLHLEDVARQTGFSDYSSFYRAFKQAFGISPRQYRALRIADPHAPPSQDSLFERS